MLDRLQGSLKELFQLIKSHVGSESVVESWSITSAVLRGQRDQLIHFWLSCPDDVLEFLWEGTAGQVTREMVAQLDLTTFFQSHSGVTQSPGRLFARWFSAARCCEGSYCYFLLSPWQFQIVNPRAISQAGCAQHRSLYEQGPPSVQAATAAQQPMASSPQAPTPFNVTRFASYPSIRCVSNYFADLINNRLQLNRMLGLSNLFYIDPEDQEFGMSCCSCANNCLWSFCKPMMPN